MLVAFAIAWFIQLFTFKNSLCAKWPATPIGSFPWQIWVAIAAGCAMYGGPLAWLAHRASLVEPYSTAHRDVVESGLGIWASMIILTGAGMLGMVVYHMGMNSWADYRRSGRRK